MLAHDEPPGYRKKTLRRRPRMAAFLKIIEQILLDDRKTPKNQRHTTEQSYERLRDEHAYPGCYSNVKEAVRDWKQAHQEVFLPLSHPPSEAQVDFGEATAEISNVATKVALFVMTLSYSGAIFMQAFPRECTETFQEGHRRVFEYLGGAPRSYFITHERASTLTTEGQNSGGWPPLQGS